jgi:hypothetical protein
MATNDEIVEQLKQLNKSVSKGTGISAVDKKVGDATAAMNPFTNALKNAGDGAKSLAEGLEKGLNTWRDLSKSGASFNNDVIGMTVAAAGTRLPLQEFAEVVKKNAADFVGFGGNAVDGAKRFAEVSKQMYDSGAAESLKQMGYTNKDLNEVLATQMGFMRSSMKDGKQRDQEAYESAAKLATEMDLMAKLTGKSREEQMENMKKAQMDMQVEAKMRLIGIKEGPEAEAKARAMYAQQFNEAQARGQGQMFKEIFATGQIMSKDAATQAAINQEQAKATRDMALATQKGQEQEAADAAKRGREAAYEDGRNVAKLNLATVGDNNAASKTIMDGMKSTRGLYDAMDAVRRENEKDVKEKGAQRMTTAEIEAEARKRVKDSQAGKDAEGKSVDGATKSMIAFGNRVDDTRAALMNGLLTPLNEKVGPGLGAFADRYLSGEKFGGSNQRMAPALEGAVKEGAASSNKPTGDRRSGDARGGSGIEGTALNVARDVGTIAGKAGDVAQKVLPTPKRQGGSLGMAGQLFENWGDGTLVELHGLESIMRPEDLNQLLKHTVDGTMAGLAEQTPAGGVDISSIAKDISTTFSSATKTSGGGSTTIKGPDLAELTRPFEKSFADFSSEFTGLITETSTDVSDSFDIFNDSWGKSLDEISNDISDAFPLNLTKELAQMRIDEAREAHDKAKEDVTRLLNDDNASDEELNSAYEKYKEAYDRLNKVVEESIGDLVEGFDDFGDNWESSIESISTDISNALPIDEFGDLEGAMKRAAEQMYPDTEFGDLEGAMKRQAPEQQYVDTEFGDLEGAMKRASAEPAGKLSKKAQAMADLAAGTSPVFNEGKLNLDSFSLGPNGMPIMKQTKAAAATIPEKTPSPGKKINPETGEEYTPVDEAAAKKGDAAKKTGDDKKSDSKPSAAGAKEATLSDVVTSLNQLNTKMGQLITKTEDLFNKQISATKSNSSNLYKAS